MCQQARRRGTGGPAPRLRVSTALLVCVAVIPGRSALWCAIVRCHAEASQSYRLVDPTLTATGPGRARSNSVASNRPLTSRRCCGCSQCCVCCWRFQIWWSQWLSWAVCSSSVGSTSLTWSSSSATSSRPNPATQMSASTTARQLRGLVQLPLADSSQWRPRAGLLSVRESYLLTLPHSMGAK
jgi:hypothetical protein